MKTIIPDVNIFIHKGFELKGKEAEGQAARELFAAAYRKKVKLIVPELFWSELMTSLRSIKGMTQDVFDANYSYAEAMSNDKVLKTARRLTRLRNRAYQISDLPPAKGQGFVPILDASYHALAEDRQGTFVTADQKYMDRIAGRVAGVIHLRDWKTLLEDTE